LSVLLLGKTGKKKKTGQCFKPRIKESASSASPDAGGGHQSGGNRVGKETKKLFKDSCSNAGQNLGAGLKFIERATEKKGTGGAFAHKTLASGSQDPTGEKAFCLKIHLLKNGEAGGYDLNQPPT